jgi:hypothetical protein
MKMRTHKLPEPVDATKEVLREKFIAMSAHIRKVERSQVTI